jgi:hypothetical protein
MPNVFLPEFEVGSDRAKHNKGGMYNPDTLIEQGDFPVNIVDMQRNEEFRAEMATMSLKIETPYMNQPRSGADINEGVSMIQPMYSDAICKHSDY